MSYVLWDRTKLNRLKRHHAKAVKEGADAFQLDGFMFLTSYAKYLIEYLETEFGRRGE